jgi:hypothetical protein
MRSLIICLTTSLGVVSTMTNAKTYLLDKFEGGEEELKKNWVQSTWKDDMGKWDVSR